MEEGVFATSLNEVFFDLIFFSLKGKKKNNKSFNKSFIIFIKNFIKWFFFEILVFLSNFENFTYNFVFKRM